MSHTSFIIAAYSVALLVLGGLIVMTVADYLRQKRLLAARMITDSDVSP